MTQTQNPNSNHSIKKETNTYAEALSRITYSASIIASGLSLFFTVFYSVGEYPPEMVLVNAFSLTLALIVFAFAKNGYTYWFLPHILVFTIYNSMVAPALFSGGISSSSIVWLVFIPVAATLLMGKKGSIIWGIIVLITVVIMYILNNTISGMALIPVRPIDKLVDLLTVLIATIGAVWISETARYKSWQQMELARFQLQKLAAIDPLTKVYNRRYFADHTLDVMSEPQSVAFLSLDLDHFKSINDRFGHEVGDQVLQMLCQRIQHNLREGDILARFGGEEFAILLLNADDKTALSIAERIRINIGQEPFTTEAGELKVTISIGLATHSGVLESKQQMNQVLRYADLALYDAKRTGRNCVKVYTAA